VMHQSTLQTVQVTGLHAAAVQLMDCGGKRDALT